MNFIMEMEETNKEPKICAMRGRSDGEWHESEHEQRIECREDGVTNTITGVSKDNMLAEPTVIANTAGFGSCYESKEVSPTIKESAFQQNNVVKEQIPLNADQDVLEKHHNLPFRVRRLTERELFRLMDVSEEDIDKIQAAGISKTQQAKMAGNSIVVNVLYEIFRKMFVDTERETAQLELF